MSEPTTEHMNHFWAYRQLCSCKLKIYWLTFLVKHAHCSSFSCGPQVCVGRWHLLSPSEIRRLTPVRWCSPPPSWLFSSLSGSVAVAPCPCCPSWAYRKTASVGVYFIFPSVLLNIFHWSYLLSFRVGVDSDQDTSVSNKYRLKYHLKK